MENKKTGHILELNLATELIHGICVSNLAFHVAEELNMDAETCHQLAVAGLIHDIGKLEISKYLYGKEEDPLTIEELKYVRTHSTLGYAILNERNYPDFVLQSILHHHENYDGSGYPSNLAGEEIPIGARVLRVCDTFAALISNRPYRAAPANGWSRRSFTMLIRRAASAYKKGGNKNEKKIKNTCSGICYVYNGTFYVSSSRRC